MPDGCRTRPSPPGTPEKHSEPARTPGKCEEGRVVRRLPVYGARARRRQQIRDNRGQCPCCCRRHDSPVDNQKRWSLITRLGEPHRPSAKPGSARWTSGLEGLLSSSRRAICTPTLRFRSRPLRHRGPERRVFTYQCASTLPLVRMVARGNPSKLRAVPTVALAGRLARSDRAICRLAVPLKGGDRFSSCACWTSYRVWATKRTHECPFGPPFWWARVHPKTSASANRVVERLGI